MGWDCDFFSALRSLGTRVDDEKAFMTHTELGALGSTIIIKNVHFFIASLISRDVIYEWLCARKVLLGCNDNLILHFVYECASFALFQHCEQQTCYLVSIKKIHKIKLILIHTYRAMLSGLRGDEARRELKERR